MKACNTSIKILLLCSRLDMPGGIERSVTNIANLFYARGYSVTVLVLDQTRGLFYPLHQSIQIRQLALDFGISKKGNTLTRKLSFISGIRTLRKELRVIEPGIIISTEYPFTVAASLAKTGMNIRLYSREAFHFHGLKKNFFWNQLIAKIYPRINSVVCMNAEEAEFFKKLRCRTVVIPNFISIKQTPATGRKKMVLTVSRLSKMKGTDMIPAIAKKIFVKHPDWQWLLIGNGDQEAVIRKEVKEKKLQSSLELIEPVSDNLDEFYETAALYISTSRFEGFPNVLIEAMSRGLPCVAFDCPTGPKHIISNYEDGLLIENENIDAMAEAITGLIENENKRKTMGANALKNIVRFSPDEVYALWEKLFAE